MKEFATILILIAAFAIPPHAAAQRFSRWSAPANLGSPVNTIQADWQPAISPDGLSLYISRFCGPPDPGCIPGNAVLWVFHRTSTNDAWANPEQLPPTINVPGKTKAMTYISADAHWLYFTSNRAGGLGGADIFRSYRNNIAMDSGADGWQTPQNLGPNVNSTSGEQMGCIFTDEATGVGTMYFSSVRAQRPDPNGGGAGAGGLAYDIYSSTIAPDGTFAPAVLVPELNDPLGSQTNPTCSRDGLEIFFTSDRSGSILYPVTPDDLYGPSGKPSPDLWVSTRASTSVPWGPPQPLDQFNAQLGGPQISSPFHDGRPYLSQDGTELYFFTPSWRSGCEGTGCYFDIYVVKRVPLYVFSGFLSPLGSARTEFKLGRTIPLKWQLQDQHGNYVDRLGAVQSLSLLYNRLCSEDPGTAQEVTSSGNTGLRYDPDANQFIFNWQTKGLSPGCYNVVLALDDTTVHSTLLTLR